MYLKNESTQYIDLSRIGLNLGAYVMKILMEYTRNQCRGSDMTKNQKGWVFAIGLLLILIACVVAYFGALPAEVNL